MVGNSSAEVATETLTWSDFKIEFENQFYSRYHRKVKKQEFLALI